MNEARTEWSVAWRFARRVTRRDFTPELVALTQARAELGRPLPLRASAAALACRWTRGQAIDELRTIHQRIHYPG